ncbi:MAG: protein kinase [Myxococcales bacterium]|nr:protein kinase [Myxococcales bacterium]
MSSFALQTGAVFADRYAVGRCLKIGGMGAVYEVTDLRTNAPRALKVMNPDFVEDPDLRARFEQEARIVGQVESDHLVRTFDAGVDPASGTPFLVMELLRGEELGAMVKRRGGLPVDEALLYLSQAARAIDKTHANGIVHRDLKPENLFVSKREDGTPCVKVLDFGIAKLVDKGGQSRLTRAAGTPMYMAPEQIQGKAGVGYSVDLYAIGQIAYTLLVGEPYWREEAKALDMFPLFQTILGGAQERPTERATRRMKVTLPPTFDAFFQRATAASADDRFPTAGELVSALAGALGQTASGRASAVDVPAVPAPTPSQPSSVPVLPPHSVSPASISSPGPITGATAQPVTTSSGLPLGLRKGAGRGKLVFAAVATATVILIPAAVLMTKASSSPTAASSSRSSEPQRPAAIAPPPVASSAQQASPSSPSSTASTAVASATTAVAGVPSVSSAPAKPPVPKPVSKRTIF